VDYAAQQVRRSHHAAGWGGLLPAQWLGERSGLPAILENDANAGGLAEALYGAGRGAQTLLYVNIGTGVGGAVVLGGRIHHGANTNAGEFGHIVLDPTGPPCPCGKRGCVEALCSGDALGRTAREDAAAEPWEGVAASDLTGRKVGGMAREGDGRALAVVERSAEWMGLALAGAANLLDPDAIVLGGGVSEMGEVYLGLVRRAFAQYAMPLPAANTPIAAAALGYDAGFVGAAAVVFAGIGGDGGARPGGRQG
jgi:glucokinase